MDVFEFNLMVWTHLIYLAIAVGVTVYVGRSLRKQGLIFATNGEDSQSSIVDAFSRLLALGFYLLSFGAVNIALKYGDRVLNAQGLIEVISTKIGVVLLILGVIHFAMTMVFAGVRNRRRADVWDAADSLDLDRRPQRQTV